MNEADAASACSLHMHSAMLMAVRQGRVHATTQIVLSSVANVALPAAVQQSGTGMVNLIRFCEPPQAVRFHVHLLGTRL